MTPPPRTVAPRALPARASTAPSPGVQRFIEHARRRVVPSRTLLISAGEPPESLFLVVSGSVEVMIEDDEGDDMVLAYLGKGQFFGEMGLFGLGHGRSAFVRARGRSEIAEMPYARFRALAQEAPSLMAEIAAQLALRLERTNRKLGDLAFVDVSGRIAHALIDLCGEPEALTHPEGMQIRVSRQELSRLVGCSREMAGRVLKSLEEQGLLRAHGKTVVVFGVRPGAARSSAAQPAAAIAERIARTVAA